MNQSYYTHTERDFLVGTYKELRYLFKEEISDKEVKCLREIIATGIEQGHADRDKYGINPIIRQMHTALLITKHFGADKNMIISVLLYNLCRTGHISKEEIHTLFGDDITSLVSGLLKVSELYIHHAAVKNENFSKLMMAFAENIRVIIIMIIDRLGLMYRINHHPNQQFVREITHEVMYLYAPLAHRLGLYKIKSELEDMSLKYSNRDMYTYIARKLNETKKGRDEYISNFIIPVEKAIKNAGLKFEIKGRTKSIYSIWNKMKKQNTDLDKIYDLFAIRIILDSKLENERKDCWMVFAILTDMYKANPSRLKDWITIPKSNGYESLHTTVYGPDNKMVEIQIRTKRMDEVAEKGLAAHWKYKGVKSAGELDNWMANVRDLLETSGKDTPELMKQMNLNIYDKEVFIFTPKGDLYRLPLGATILDFAFTIHSKLGCTCIGGKVNGKNQKLNYKLQNGDSVEILTSSTQQPKQQWLYFVITSKARNKIRQAINEINNKAAEFAKELLQRRFKNRKIEIEESTLTKVIKKRGYKTATEFYNDISNEKIDINDVVDTYIAIESKEEELSNSANIHSAQDFVLQQPTQNESSSNDFVTIGEGIKDINFKLSKCCNPILGDNIVGFISSDGAVKIHKSNCPNAKHLASKYPYRVINAVWSDRIGDNLFTAKLNIIGVDNISIVNNITSLISKEKNVLLKNISIDSHDGLFQGRLVIGINNSVSLNNLIKKITNIKGIKNVQRNG